jgi:hypothetical protein
LRLLLNLFRAALLDLRKDRQDSGSDCASTQTALGRKGRCQETSRYANPPETAEKSVHSNHSFIVIGRAQNQHTSLPQVGTENQARGYNESAGHNPVVRYPVAAYLERAATAQRRIATTDHTASTNPNGQAPCKKPYAEPRMQAPAKARMNHLLLDSRA